MTVSRMQIRPKGAGENAVFYSPQRDLAYFYAPFMKEALMGLREPYWPAGMEDVSRGLGATEEAMTAGVKALMDAHLQFTNVPDIPDAAAALRKAGWFDVPPVVRVMIYYRMGEVLLGGFFLALRDVSKMGETSPQAEDIAEFVGMGRLVAEQMSGRRAVLTDIEQLRHELHSAQALVVLQDNAAAVRQSQIESAQVETRKAHKEIERLAHVLRDSQASHVATTAAMKTMVEMQDAKIVALESRSAWQVYKSHWSKWWSGRTHNA